MSRLLVDSDSKPVTLPKFNYFSTPGTITEIEKLVIVRLLPLASLSGARVFEFHYIATDNEAVDISKTKLRLTIELRRKDGKKITAHISIAPANGIGHSLFQDVKISMMDVPVDTTSGMYQYSNYYTVVLNYSEQALLANFTSSMYRMDIAGKMEVFKNTFDVKTAAVAASTVTNSDGTTTNIAEVKEVKYSDKDTNHGFFIRSLFMEKNKEYELIVPIQTSLTNQSRVIPPRVDLKFQFTKADAESYLLANNPGIIDASEYEIHISKAELELEKLQLERTKLHA